MLHAQYFLPYQTAACQLHLLQPLPLVEEDHLRVHMVEVAAGRMVSMDVVILGTVEEGEEGDLMTALAVVCLRESGGGAKLLRTESLASAEEEVEVTEVTGVVVAVDEDDGSWT